MLIEDNYKNFLENLDTENIWNNKEIVLSLIKKSDLFFEYASDELRDDKEVVLFAISQNISSFRYVSDRFKDDYDIVLDAVKQNPCYLMLASERLKDDYDIVFQVVKQDCTYLEHASNKLQNNITLLRLLKNHHNKKDMSYYDNSYVDWYKERMEALKILEILEFEEELKNNMPIHDIVVGKLNKF